jgi:hypothetical protein
MDDLKKEMQILKQTEQRMRPIEQNASMSTQPTYSIAASKPSHREQQVNRFSKRCEHNILVVKIFVFCFSAKILLDLVLPPPLPLHALHRICKTFCRTHQLLAVFSKHWGLTFRTTFSPALALARKVH